MGVTSHRSPNRVAKDLRQVAPRDAEGTFFAFGGAVQLLNMGDTRRSLASAVEVQTVAWTYPMPSV